MHIFVAIACCFHFNVEGRPSRIGQRNDENALVMKLEFAQEKLYRSAVIEPEIPARDSFKSVRVRNGTDDSGSLHQVDSLRREVRVAELG